MANTFVGVGVGIVTLVLIATGLAVVFATRGAMAGNREVVEVLHFVGANDDFIARAFQRRFFRLGLRGGIIGSCLALAVFALAGLLAPGLAPRDPPGTRSRPYSVRSISVGAAMPLSCSSASSHRWSPASSRG